jgi:hypothetical protein
MRPIKKLSKEEYDTLLQYPVYMSLLASNVDGKLDSTEKKAALKFSHIKTFKCVPLLTEFYKDADKVFEKNIEQLDKDLPKDKESRKEAINEELLILEKIALKMGKNYASTLHQSMQSFKEHVQEAHHNFIFDFILPIPMFGNKD